MFSLARGYALWILLFKNKWTLFSFHKSYGSWPKDVLLSYLKFGSHHIVTPLVPIGSLSIYLMLYNKSWNRLLLWLVLYLIFFRYLLSYHWWHKSELLFTQFKKRGWYTRVIIVHSILDVGYPNLHSLCHLLPQPATPHLNLKTVSLFGVLSSSSSLWPSFLTTCPNLDYSHHHLSTPRLNLMCLYLLFYHLHLRCLVFFFSVQSSEVAFFFSSLHSLFISLCKVHVKILFYIIKVRKKNI